MSDDTWTERRDSDRLTRIRQCLSQGLSRRGAARALGIGLPKVNELLDLSEDTEDTRRREPCSKRKRCVECGAPAVDVLFQRTDDGAVIKRPLCRIHMCPDPTPEQREAERWYHLSRSLGSNLGQSCGPCRNDSMSLYEFNKLLNAAMKRIGLDPDVPQSVAFGQLASGGGGAR